MSNQLFTTPAKPVIPVHGSDKTFPIHRIFCIGRNYEAHALELGGKVDRDEPFYFTKSPDSVVVANDKTPVTIPMAMGTKNYHYEMELVVFLHSGGAQITTQNALNCVYGYGCGLDMTRRDLQNKAKDTGKPWDYSKSFEHSAILGSITPRAQFGNLANQQIQLSQNGTIKQNATIDTMVWKVEEIIAYLSQYHILQAGDIIYTGTPAGVGAVQSGDTLHGSIAGLTDILINIQ